MHRLLDKSTSRRTRCHCSIPTSRRWRTTSWDWRDCRALPHLLLHRRAVGLLLVDRGPPLLHSAPQQKARTTARTNSAPSDAPPADSRFFAASMVDRWPISTSSRPEYSVIISSILWPFSGHAASGAVTKNIKRTRGVMRWNASGF